MWPIAVIPPNQLTALQEADETAFKLANVGTISLIFLGYIFLASFPAIGFYSLILGYIQDEEPGNIVGVILNLFTHFSTYLLPLIAMIVLFILGLIVVGIFIGLLPILEGLIIIGSSVFFILILTCFFIYLADEKNIKTIKTITSTFNIIFSDFRNWGLFCLLLLFGVVIDHIIFYIIISEVDVKTWATVSFSVWIIFYFFFYCCVLECLAVLSYRQSKARLF